ncbi:MAG: ComF family protein [Bdellovibrionales bacterium]
MISPWLSQLSTTANGMTQAFLDLLFPPLCLSCGTVVGTNGALCPRCWQNVSFIAPPLCHGCGMPFEIPMNDKELCPDCKDKPHIFASARASFLYDTKSRKIVLGFKHGDQTHAAQALASWIYHAGEPYWREADIIAPVPLHRWRLLKRRYNQSALLAKALSNLAKKPVCMQTLVRTRATDSQGHRTRKQRQENVAGAFAVQKKYQTKIQNACVVLIDDVMTTGATLDECARTLISSGAKKVYALTLARTNSRM